MKTLKLVFFQKQTTERNDGSPVTMEFRGHWDNNSNEPKMTLRFSECNEESSQIILEDLGLITPGEVLFIQKGVNPQARLDDFLALAVKRRTPQISNFEKEIEDFDDEMLEERYDNISKKLGVLITENKQDTKEFDFYFGCLVVIYRKRWRSDIELDKEGWIRAYKEAESLYDDSDSDEEETSEVSNVWRSSPIEEEE